MTKNVMPQGFEQIFKAVEHEVIWLHAKWITYRQLYADSEERIDLLNYIAPTVFYIIQEMYLDDVTLTLSRLTDPKSSRGGGNNLSLHRLVNELDSQMHPTLFKEISEDWKAIETACSSFRIRRNRTIAHLDLPTTVQSKMVPGISRQMVEEALKSIRQLMNRINVYFTGTETGYEHFFHKDDGESLINALEEAVAYQNLDRKKWGLPPIEV